MISRGSPGQHPASRAPELVAAEIKFIELLKESYETLLPIPRVQIVLLSAVGLIALSESIVTGWSVSSPAVHTRAGCGGSKIAAQRGLPKPFGDNRKLPDWMATTMPNAMSRDFLSAPPPAVVPKGAVRRLS
jgi:hypothetical protein